MQGKPKTHRQAALEALLDLRDARIIAKATGAQLHNAMAAHAIQKAKMRERSHKRFLMYSGKAKKA